MNDDFATKSAASLLGDLSPAEQAEWTQQLERDPQARARHEELTAMNTLLDSHISAAAPAPDFEQRMVGGFRRRSQREPLLARLSRWTRLPAVYIPAAAAALLALVQLGSTITGEGFPGTEGSTRRITVSAAAKVPLPAKRVSTSDADNRVQNAQKELAKSDDYSSATQVQSGLTVSSGETFAKAQPNAPVTATAQPEISSEFAKNAWGVNKPMPDEGRSQQAQEPQEDPDMAASSAGGGAIPTVPAESRKLIRNASVEVEVKAFDDAAQKVTDLANTAGGYVATRNSSRLSNGKMTGTLIVKVPPAALDGFLTQLRGLGEIRNQTLGSEDVTKAYFDTDARLRNARHMEDGLLELLKNTKGRVADLLQVERELGRVRGEIEEMQGQLKLWDSLISFATVTVQLSEKNLDEAAAYRMSRLDTLLLATADVEETFQQANAIAATAKAQVVQSNVSRDVGGQAGAVLVLLLDPVTADATVAQLEGIAHVLNYHSATERVARGGSTDAANARVERDRVQLTVSIASQDQTPAQRTQLRIETPQVEGTAAALRQFLADKGAKIEGSSFAQLADGGQNASLRASFPLASYPEILARFQQAGAVKNLTVQRDDAGKPGATSDRAEITAQFVTPPRLVANDSGLLATLRHTFTQAFGALMWSLRMIGVAFAFLAPWLAVLAGALLLVRFLRRRKR
jgi:anti-sigma factor RsiW